MSDADHDLAVAAKAFRKSIGYKMETLLPHRGAVLELRSKGASLALISRLLENVGIHVSTDTIRRLCLREPYNSHRMASPPKEGLETGPETSLPAVTSRDTPQTTFPRGPRIADPNTQ